MPRSLICATALWTVLCLAASASDSVTNPLTDSEMWDMLREDIVGTAPIEEGDALFSVEAPHRAHDAATVPVRLRQMDERARIDKMTVVIDENPAPVAAELSLSPAMAPLDFEFRVRVNQYSNIRVIAQTQDGLFMTGRFVKASGGCAAPASRDPQIALATMGEMKLRSFLPAPTTPQMSPARREAQIMVRHPNYSGLQRDQITQLFIPAHFIDHLEVWQGEELLFAMDGGISISENPVFRFAYTDNGSETLRVVATDTEGNHFEELLPKSTGS